MTKVDIVTYQYQTSCNEHKAIQHMYTEYTNSKMSTQLAHQVTKVTKNSH